MHRYGCRNGTGMGKVWLVLDWYASAAGMAWRRHRNGKTVASELHRTCVAVVAQERDLDWKELGRKGAGILFSLRKAHSQMLHTTFNQNDTLKVTSLVSGTIPRTEALQLLSTIHLLWTQGP